MFAIEALVKDENRNFQVVFVIFFFVLFVFASVFFIIHEQMLRECVDVQPSRSRVVALFSIDTKPRNFTGSQS